MPALPYQPPPYVLSPTQSRRNPSTEYSQMQPTYPSASIPRGVTSFSDYDACQGFTDEPVEDQDYQQDAQTSSVYADSVVNYQYQNGAQPPHYWQAATAVSSAPAHPQPLGMQHLHRQNMLWEDLSIPTSSVPSAAESSHSPIYPPGPYTYMPMQNSASGRRSRSSEAISSPSPYLSSHLSLPQTPNMPIDGVLPASYLSFKPLILNFLQNLDSHREQLRLFKEALSLPLNPPAGPFVPQRMYMPHTNSDRRRYVEEIELQQPIYFWMESPVECGISLIDALHSRVRRLQQRDEPVFEGRGPSISVRIQWPGYRPWSRQIPTKDFRSPPQPITKAKLAKNIAKCVERFLSARAGTQIEDDADARWEIGPLSHEIKLEDLCLVSMHHVSMGSWQPHLRLLRPLRPLRL